MPRPYVEALQARSHNYCQLLGALDAAIEDFGSADDAGIRRPKQPLTQGVFASRYLSDPELDPELARGRFVEHLQHHKLLRFGWSQRCSDSLRSWEAGLYWLAESLLVFTVSAGGSEAFTRLVAAAPIGQSGQVLRAFLERLLYTNGEYFGVELMNHLGVPCEITSFSPLEHAWIAPLLESAFDRVGAGLWATIFSSESGLWEDEPDRGTEGSFTKPPICPPQVEALLGDSEVWNQLLVPFRSVYHGPFGPQGFIIGQSFRIWCLRYFDWVDPVFVDLRRDDLLREGPFAPVFKSRILNAYLDRVLGK